MEKRLIDIINVSKEIAGTVILKEINLFVRKNEFVTLLGPSGCGKTTTLRMIGGFESPTKGELLFDGKSMLNVPIHKRNINTVFQKYALFPHMNIGENIGFGLKIKKVDKKDIDYKVESMLEIVNLKGFASRNINSLSGGQQQRVAIARALVNEPEVLLLDEPLGALDLKLRKEMQVELKNIQKNLGITFIYVTHDQEEALTMSDTIAIMNKGEMQQIGTPQDIYNEPKNAFVASFIGDSNVVEGLMIEDFLVEINGAKFQCIDSGFGNNVDVEVVIRPEDIEIMPKAQGQIEGVVTNITFKGVHYEISIQCGDYTWTAQSTNAPVIGDAVGVYVKPELIHIMKKVAL
jgi:spermidine/putrescine transport system ATP-binding protein